MNFVTIKTTNHIIFNFEDINKVICTIDASSIAKLLDNIALTANPRKSKCNKITKAIQETLEHSPEYMVFKSKGILLSTGECEALERGRFKMRVEEPKTDGLLDGGHNMLAIGMFLLKEYFEDQDLDEPAEYKKIKGWDNFIDVWHVYSDKIKANIDDFNFLISVEIIYPAPGKEDVFTDKVFEISDARNNNYALTSGTKADHKGYYEILKASIDKNINSQIEWKDGDFNKSIKRESVVSLALIPLIALQRQNRLGKTLKTINPAVIYNSKQTCIEIFTNLIEEHTNEDGDLELPKVIENAFKLMEDIPSFFDLIYKRFPEIYNKSQGSFGKISSVKQKKDSNKKIIKDAYRTKFYDQTLDYKYPEAFILPIVVSLNELIAIEGDNVSWKFTNMKGFIENNLTNHCGMLVSTIKDNNYDPQSVGKSTAAYKGMEMELGLAEMKINK